MAILSPGNIKLGKVLNVSLPPIVSCNGCSDYCGTKCYSMKAYRMYPAVRNNWDSNLALAKDNLDNYFTRILHEILKKRAAPKYFRWHVSGDILSLTYFKGMCAVAVALPYVKFLCFTKQYNILNEYVKGEEEIPSNLQIVFSAWPGLPLNNPHNFRVAWMQDGTEDRIPSNAMHCPGNCETCGACFSLNEIGKDAVFELH